ncbi:NAD(P)-dependent oxidoreductase, partial [Myxococcus vastator]|uniref:NAD(P)-dependent oxidoreductase n=1 Tax=Myxococcus vastator TaxID=2709664 RepID=UPI0013D11F7A
LQAAGLLAAIHDKAGAEGLAHLCAPSAEAVARTAGIVFLCLPNPQAVEEVASELIRTGAAKDKVVVDFSTTLPALTRRLGEAFAEAGASYLEAPMTGGVRAVRNRRLRVIVGGEHAVFQRLKPILDLFVDVAIYAGAVGVASSLKLVHNMVTLGTAFTVMEAVSLAEKLSLDRELLFRVLSNGTASSYVIDNTLRRTLLEGDFREGFKLELAEKDARLIQQLAAEAGAHLSMFPVAAEMLREGAARKELAQVDYPAVFDVVVERMSVKRGERVPSPAVES